MMEYEMFKELVADHFLDYMPQEFQGYSVKISPTNKVNQKLDGVELIPPGDKAMKVFPVVYANHMYEDYLNGQGFEEVMEQYAKGMQDIHRNLPDAVPSSVFSNAEEKIIMELINTEQNRELLESIPHREIVDLSIVYRIVTGMGDGMIYSALINNAHAEQIGMGEERMYEVASENTWKMLPPVAKRMSDVMREIFVVDGMAEEQAGQAAETMVPTDNMYVVTNDRNTNGAVSMLYEEKLHEIAEGFGSDLYILPSSVHEVIAVPTSMWEPEELAEIVADINMGMVSLGERLSNQVYHYDKDLRELTLATDTPNKRLDTLVAEPPMSYGKGQSR